MKHKHTWEFVCTLMTLAGTESEYFRCSECWKPKTVPKEESDEG